MDSPAPLREDVVVDKSGLEATSSAEPDLAKSLPAMTDTGSTV